MDCGVKLHEPWKLLNVIDIKIEVWIIDHHGWLHKHTIGDSSSSPMIHFS
jgi:hypothetical protein